VGGRRWLLVRLTRSRRHEMRWGNLGLARSWLSLKAQDLGVVCWHGGGVVSKLGSEEENCFHSLGFGVQGFMLKY